MVNITGTGANQIAGASSGFNKISVWIGDMTTKFTELIAGFGVMEYAMIIGFVILVIALFRVNSRIQAMKKSPTRKLRNPYRRGRR